MLTITLRPQEDARCAGAVIAEWFDPVLTLDGTDYDLSLLEHGAIAAHPLLGFVSRAGEDYEVSLILRYRHGAPEETVWPQPITVTENGPIQLPPYEAEPEPEEPSDAQLD